MITTSIPANLDSMVAIFNKNYLSKKNRFRQSNTSFPTLLITF